MGTGNFLVSWSSDPLLSNEKVITAGSSVTLHTDATAIYINATTSTGAGGGTAYLPIQPQQAKLLNNNSSALISVQSSLWTLIFSPTTQQYGSWQYYLPQDYSSNPYVSILWGMDSGTAVAKSCTCTVSQWGSNPFLANSSIYIDTYGASNTVSIALSAGYSSGNLQSITVPLVNVVSMAGGNLIRLRVSGSGTPGNMELYASMFSYLKA